MPYQINRYNNDLLTVVEDGTVNNTTTLKFVGKNFAGYGEIQNENFLHLLENFSNVTAPPRALSGQLWYDSVNKKLKFYDGVAWKTTGGSEVSGAQPIGLTAGDFWWDTSNQQLYVFNGESFVLIGPQIAGSGITQMISKEIFDVDNNLKSIIAATVEDEIVAVISPVTFTAKNPAIDLPGFTGYIRQGTTLPNTGTNGITTSAHRYWGTASNSDRLGGKLPAEFVTQDQLEGNSFEDGILIKSDFRIYVNSDLAILEHGNKNLSKIIFRVTNNSQQLQTPAIIDHTGIAPSLSNTFDLGTVTNRWKTVYASEFNGVATASLALRVGSSNLQGRTTAEVNSVAVRDNAGNLSANLFQGIATAARYADLAEKYTTAEEYSVGTLVSVSGNEEHELEISNKNDIVIGVVSEYPAYLMNAEAPGQAIALKGRVPVRIVGPVVKGQAIYAWTNGTASTVPTGAIVGVALTSNLQTEEKLVECVLKV
jgi:hypothetical protein